MTKDKNIKQHVKIWYAIGRIAPLGALFLLCIALVFDIQGWLEWLLCGIGTVFAIIAFTWWWWVIYAVRDIFTMLNRANKKFEEVLVEIKKIKLESTKLKKRKK